VSEPSPLLDREGIEEAFRRLGDWLAKRSVVADIFPEEEPPPRLRLLLEDIFGQGA
jgi:hypothetical protein